MRCLRSAFASLALFLMLGLLIGCVATETSNYKLKTVPQITNEAAIGRMYVGPFIDMRKDGNGDTTVLGTIRGGYSNPLTRIRHNGGADEFVRDQVINAARTLNIVADRKPDSIVVQRSNTGWNVERSAAADRLILVGVIRQLIVETGWSRGTIVDIAAELIDPATNVAVWKAEVVGRDSGGFGGGVFESSTGAKQWLGETVEKAASKLLSTVDFAAALKTPIRVVQSARPPQLEAVPPPSPPASGAEPRSVREQPPHTAGCDKPVAVPTFRVDEKWTWRDTAGKEWSHQVVAVEGSTTSIKWSDGDIASYDGEWVIRRIRKSNGELVTEQGSGQFTEVGQRALDFPLLVGKQWGYRYLSRPVTGVGSPQQYYQRYKVIACEKVATPAGSFPAFKIEVVQSVTSSGRSGTYYLWWAPQVKQYVKRQFTASTYWGERVLDYELVGFEFR